ncbi:MAG: cyclohexadienyl dehydratase [Halioglobus sp.]|jgi:cyclohexadienyl dehydratase
MRSGLIQQYRLLLKLLSILPALLLTLSVSADDLTPLVEQRLGYMKDVAAYKWQHKLLIENVEREAVVLDAALGQALRFGLTKDSSRYFFSVQISAAKEIQAYWFRQWQNNPNSVPENDASLEHEIRPALLNLGEAIAAALVDGEKNLSGLKVEGLSTPTASQLASAAQAVTTYPNRLAQVLDSSILRVGTTGDYAPFSFRPDSSVGSAQWSGIDIDLAKNLAQSLGVAIQWVHTSWPMLMQDLHNGRFDIGMSGISINLTRQQTAFFSTAYHRGGKAPLIRCADSGKYGSLDDIDQNDTRVIVNPGGTNQKFTDANIHQASIAVHDDNRSIFNEIINHTADVMFTDKIEIELQTRRHAELCAAMGEQTLTYSEKGFLLPQDVVWKAYVDTWLNIRSGDGTVEKLFNTHL